MSQSTALGLCLKPYPRSLQRTPDPKARSREKAPENEAKVKAKGREKNKAGEKRENMYDCLGG